MELLGYGAAILMGFTLGLFGGGGSILTVPILVYLFQFSAQQSTGYSLFVVGLSSIFGAWTYHKKGLIRYRVGAVFAVPSVVGVYTTRRYILPSIPEEILSVDSFMFSKDMLIMLVFAVVMLLASIAMIKKPKFKATTESKGFNYPLVAIEGLLVGGVTGFVGAGGGFLIVPAIVLLARLEMKEAVGTSLAIISVKSLIGFAGDIQVMGSPDWMFLGVFSALSVVGIFMGTFVSSRVDSGNLKPAFGYFVLTMGLFILDQQVLS